MSVSSETPPSTGSLIAFPRARLPPAVTELQAKNSPPTTSSDARRPLLRRLRARGLQSTVGKNAQTLVYKRQGVLKLVCEVSASQNKISRATLGPPPRGPFMHRCSPRVLFFRRRPDTNEHPRDTTNDKTRPQTPETKQERKAWHCVCCKENRRALLLFVI